MRTKQIPTEFYNDGTPIIKINTIHPKLTEVEIPLSRINPVVLRSPKGVPIVYLISYKPITPCESNVDITNHSFYVEKETYDEVVEIFNKYNR